MKWNKKKIEYLNVSRATSDEEQCSNVCTLYGIRETKPGECRNENIRRANRKYPQCRYNGWTWCMAIICVRVNMRMIEWWWWWWWWRQLWEHNICKSLERIHLTIQNDDDYLTEIPVCSECIFLKWRDDIVHECTVRTNAHHTEISRHRVPFDRLQFCTATEYRWPWTAYSLPPNSALTVEIKCSKHTSHTSTYENNRYMHCL